MFARHFRTRLNSQRQAGLFRNPPEIDRREGKYVYTGDRKLINFSSNDYLGLSLCEEVKKKVAQNFRKYGTSSGSSRLVSGHYSLICRAEAEYARFFGYAEALFFPSGYQANLALISTLFDRSDTLFFDKHIHASSVKGMTLSGADFRGYNHNDISHLAKRLAKTGPPQAAVLTESLFSMDGDLLDVTGLAELKKHHTFLTLVDEAHAFGALGSKGRGIAGGVADIAVGTLGKAFGLFGAFALLPAGFKEYLFNFASPLIYTTTLPEAHAASAMDLLELISGSGHLREQLRRVSRQMKDGLTQTGFKVAGDAHILAVEIGDENAAVEISRGLFEQGFFVFSARFPTVPMHRAILRISLNALHTETDIEQFIHTLSKVHRSIEKEN